MKKSYTVISIFLITSFCLFGQNIKLPDVTTVIEGESKKVGKDALPEFKDIIEKTTGSGTIVPQLPNVDQKKAPEAITTEKNKSDKTVFSQVLVGGGYPFLFYGDCNISGVNEANPFKLAFNFDSAKGYNGKPLTDNYSDSSISLSFDKDFKKNNLTWGFFAQYNSKTNGLQNQVVGITSYTQDFIIGKGDINYKFNNGLYIGSNIGLDFYSRHGNITGENEFQSWIKRSTFLNFVPTLDFGWENYGFKIGLNGKYTLDSNLFDYVEGGDNHRGEFGLNFQWSNDIIRTFGNASFAFGNQFENGWFLVPFNAGIDFSLPVSFANRRFVILGEGGLKTSSNSVKDLENKYKFSVLSETPAESALWYGKLNIDVPVKSSFTGNFGIEYKQTAFDKGVLEPVFSADKFTNGFYSYEKLNQKYLTTDFSITYNYRFFSVNGGWHSNWLDVPQLEAMQSISVNLSFQDEKSRWGTSIFGSYDVSSIAALPIINFDCYIQLSPTVRLTGSLDDLITVFTKDVRNYGGNYIERGFHGGIFLKFVL